MLLTALVDYFNVAPLRPAVRRTLADYRDALDHVVSTLVGTCYRLSPRPDEIGIRIYGGWHYSEPPRSTEARDMLSEIVASAFPTRRPIRIKAQLAESILAAPDLRLHATLRLLPGMSPFRVDDPPVGCAHLSSCSIQHVSGWRRGKCSMVGCEVRTRDACRSIRQKLVDTAITCDALHLASTDTGNLTLVFSDDDDLVPGLLAAASRSPGLMQLRPPRDGARFYDTLLLSQGVTLIDC